jgi:hypothetical protein
MQPGARSRSINPLAFQRHLRVLQYLQSFGLKLAHRKDFPFPS